MIMIPSHLVTTPPLENGDSPSETRRERLSRVEFERRYQAMPNLRKAELIEGIVYTRASPLRIKSHGEPHADLNTWLGTYKALTPGIIMGIEPTVRLDPDNAPQPDAVLFIPDRQATIAEDDYIEGAPELVVEIAASSAALDLYDKKRVYRRNGVQDYLVWRTLEGQLDWFRLTSGEYVPLEADEQGILSSQVFQGLWLDRAALLSGDMARVLAVLQAGMATAA
ncbi:MAG: Uma2 family endonuclease [Leptolyngbyaceae cyanobacterium]